MTTPQGNGWRPSDELIEAGLNELKKGFGSVLKGLGQNVKADASQLKEEVKTAGEKLRPEPSPMQRDVAARQVRKAEQLEVLNRIADALERIEKKLPEPRPPYTMINVPGDQPLRDRGVPPQG